MAEDSEEYFQAYKEWQDRIRANGSAPVLGKENMSQNRHCDRHDGDFSVRDPDWSEMRGTIHGRYEDGSPNDRTESLDFCASCTRIMLGIGLPGKPEGTRETVPKMNALLGQAMTPQQAQQALIGKKMIAVDPEEHSRYIRWLEQQNGIGFPPSKV
jgi:hypothetical protein